jgi:nicotinamidase-related amidase
VKSQKYKKIIENISRAVEWVLGNDIHVVYIKHNHLSAGTRTFKLDTHGAELGPEIKIVSENIFTKQRAMR